MEENNFLNQQFIDAAEDAVTTLPAWVQKELENIIFVVEAFPDTDIQVQMATESPYDLLGLYTGTPLPMRAAYYGFGNLPDTVHLFREPILAYCEENDIPLAQCVRHVVVHEVGHYLGLSDEDMEEIESRP